MEQQDSVITPTDLSPRLASAGGYGIVTAPPEGLADAPDLASPEGAGKRAILDIEIPTQLPESKYAHASDDQLLTAAKSSDGRAFEELACRYMGAVRRRVYSIVRNREDTEDVMQESLLSAYCHLRNFRESCTFSTWITQIAINSALMLLRRRRSRPELSRDQQGETDQTWNTCEPRDPSPSTERAYATQEAIEIMSRAVESLPALYRNVLEQYHAQEKSLREAADNLGITVASAKSRLLRARRTLRSRLEGRHVSISHERY